jgi:hypothetical protein
VIGRISGEDLRLACAGSNVGNFGGGREMTEAEALGCGQQAKGKSNRSSKQRGAAGVEK